MKKFKAIWVLASAAIALGSAAYADWNPLTDDPVISRFCEIAQVPRPSHHEERISQWLVNWATNRSLAVQQDAVGNVIIDVPATEGMEDRKLVGL